MQIHCITGNTKQNKPVIDEITQAIAQNDSTLTVDIAKPRTPNWTAAVEKDIDAIQRSDLIIAEATEADLELGVLAFTAFRYKKPTLILAPKAQAQHLSEVANKYLVIKPYQTKDEIKGIVTAFIKENAIAERDLRFNMFLNRPVYRYLRTTAYETGKTKSQIARDIVEQAAQKRGR